MRKLPERPGDFVGQCGYLFEAGFPETRRTPFMNVWLSTCSTFIHSTIIVAIVKDPIIGLMKAQLLFLTLFIFSTAVKAQTGTSIQVNPDGTHTVVHHNGNSAIQANSDGTHSTIFHNGNTSTRVNPNGTHTITFHSEHTSTQINPDGTHTAIFHNKNSSTQVNPDGTHTIIYRNIKQKKDKR